MHLYCDFLIINSHGDHKVLFLANVLIPSPSFYYVHPSSGRDVDTSFSLNQATYDSSMFGWNILFIKPVCTRL